MFVFSSLGAARKPELHPAVPEVVRSNDFAWPQDWFYTLQPIPTVIPAPWAHQDVGNVATPGDASYSWGVVSVTASGDGIGNQADAFHFVYQPSTGDGELTALITSFENPGSNAKAGLMIRANLNADSPSAAISVNPTGKTAFDTRTAVGRVTDSTQGPVIPIGCWVRLTRSGSACSGYVSADGVSWTKVGSASIGFSQPPLIGLAATAGDNAAVTRADFTAITPSGAIQPLNAPPSVTITSPLPSSVLSSSEAGFINVFAIDSDGTIQKIEIYDGAAKLGESNTSQYHFSWNNPTVGSHSLTARATDNLGATRTSNPVDVSVTGVGFRIESPGFDPATDSFTFQFQAPAKSQYVVEASSDLRTWIPLATNSVSALVTSFLDRRPPATEQFYRIRLP
jgi:hypothetical protein